jgi:large subunit ribosomal protein L24
MANKLHVRKDEQVLILSGEYKGKKGKVLATYPDKNMVLVEGVNMRTRHVKPKNAKQPGGLVKQELPINASKVMVICKSCDEPTRVARRFSQGGEKEKVCRKCGALITTLKEAKE